MLRACAVCTLLYEDPLRDACEACGSSLPKLEPGDCTVSSSSDSAFEDLNPRPAKTSRSENGGASSSSSSPPKQATTSVERPDRTTAIADDFAVVQRQFTACGGSSLRVSDLALDEDSVNFSVMGYDGAFNIFLTDDYPAGESNAYGPDDWQLSWSGTISDVLQATLHDLRRRLEQRASVVRGRGYTEEARAPFIGCDLVMDSQHAASPPYQSLALDDDCAASIMEDRPMEAGLQRDVESLQQYLGATAVDCTSRADNWRIRARIDMFVPAETGQVEMPIIDATTARAWGIDPCKPLGIEVQLPMSGYLEPACMPSRVVTSVWQESFPGFQLEKQLMQILGDFCDTILHKMTHGCHGQGSSRRDKAGSVEQEYMAKKESMMLHAQADKKNGFLVHLVHYMRLRLVTVNEYCAICDGPFIVPPMFMRSVCSRDLCSYQFCEFGERITTAEGVNTQAEIVDMLVCMFARAVMSSRRELIVDPYPCISADSHSKELIFDPKRKDFAKLQQVVTGLITLRDGYVAKMGAAWTSMTKSMTKEGQALVQWIVASNRSYLAPLQETYVIKAFKTPFQYLLISAPPDREARFQKLKQQHGSVFAYHGSGTENWHSILRNGLKNCSNTKLMTAGAAHGAGIYLSTRSMLSVGYSTRGAGWSGAGVTRAAPAPQTSHLKRQAIGNRSLEGMQTLFMLAVCEVINHSSLKRVKEIWVMPNEEMVMTRFFLVFTESNPCSDISITDLEGQVQKCIDALKC